jgi:hypothetical protein
MKEKLAVIELTVQHVHLERNSSQCTQSNFLMVPCIREIYQVCNLECPYDLGTLEILFNRVAVTHINAILE